MSDLDRGELDDALTTLLGVTTGDAAPLTQLRGQAGALEAAFTHLGTYLGTRFEVSRSTESSSQPIHDVVRAARCRSRVVTLTGDWWKRPGAAMLAFVDDGVTPIALIPGRTRYRVPATADVAARVLDARSAAEFGPTAHVVYRPFPARATARTIIAESAKMVRPELIRLLGFGVLAAVVSTLTPLAVTSVFASVLPTGSDGLLAAVTALLFGAAVTASLVTYTQNVVSLRLAGRLAATLEPALTDRLIRLPSSFFRRYDTGDLAARASGLEVIRQLVAGPVLTAVLGTVVSTASLAVLFIYSPVLAMLALLVILVAVIILVRLNVTMVRTQATVLSAAGDASASAFQTVRAIAKIRVAAAEQRMMTRWVEHFSRQQRASFMAGSTQSWIVTTATAIPAAMTLVIYLAVIGGVAGRLSPARFLGFIAATGQFTVALAALVATIAPLLAVVPLWRRLAVILDEPAEPVGEEAPGALTGQISLRDISFAYEAPDSPRGRLSSADAQIAGAVLTQISIDIAPGEFVAFTGPSGSGKSTLLRILIGIDEPTAGVVEYDGRDLRSLDGSAVRRQLGVVMQNAAPLPGSVFGSIVGDTGADEEAAWAAAEAASVADDIRAMPMKMQTIVAEGGLTMSGGQIQRIMIARALVRKPRIVVFDEATSALDDLTQSQVSARITELDSTRIVVAHRLSTIRYADRIHVLDGGRIVESGTFDELMAIDGLFARLARRQLI